VTDNLFLLLTSDSLKCAMKYENFGIKVPIYRIKLIDRYLQYIDPPLLPEYKVTILFEFAGDFRIFMSINFILNTTILCIKFLFQVERILGNDKFNNLKKLILME